MKTGILGPRDGRKKGSPLSSNLRVSEAGKRQDRDRTAPKGKGGQALTKEKRRAAEAFGDAILSGGAGFLSAPSNRLTAGGNLTPRQREIFYHLMASYPAGVFVEGDRPAIDAYCQLAEMREAAVSRAEALGAYSAEISYHADGALDMDVARARDAAIRQVHSLSQMLFSAAQRVRATPNTRLAFSEGHEGMASALAAERDATVKTDILGDIQKDLSTFLGAGKTRQ